MFFMRSAGGVLAVDDPTGKGRRYRRTCGRVISDGRLRSGRMWDALWWNRVR
jgi:hypothetical protein